MMTWRISLGDGDTDVFIRIKKMKGTYLIMTCHSRTRDRDVMYPDKITECYFVAEKHCLASPIYNITYAHM